MRQSLREVKDLDKIIDIINRADTMRVGMNAGEFPYIVPLSFGFEMNEMGLVFYFHSARQGRKVDLIKSNESVCVEIDNFNGYVTTDMGVTVDYESVIAFGKAVKIEDFDEKIKGLDLLMQHCKIEGFSIKDCVLTGVVDVYKIIISEFSAKKRF